MSAAGAVNIRLGAITTEFVNAWKNAGTTVKQSVSGMNADLASFYKTQERQRAVFSKGFGKLADDFKSVGSRLTTGLTGPLALASGLIANTYADIEQLRRSGEAYGFTLNDIKKIAKAPGLGFEEASSSLVSLRSVKYDADLAKAAVAEFGNALSIAGKGKAELSGVALAFQQIKSKGSIQAEEINQIAERMPQIRDIMKEAFGTSNSEDLQKLGIGADEFLSKVVTGLSKLPRATVGPKIAWENFTDGLKVGAYEIGSSADRLYGFTESLNGLGDMVSDSVEGFKDLPDAAKLTIFSLASVAAAIGPVSLAIGGAINLFPTFLSGFKAIGVAATAIASPIGLAVAAVALLGTGAYSIYQYTRAVDSSIDKSKIMATVNNQVTKSVEEQTSKLGALLEVAYNEKESKQARLNAIRDINALSPQYLGNLRLETLHTTETAKALQKYVEAITLKAKAQALSNQLVASQEKLVKLQSEGMAGQVGFMDQLAATLLNAGSAGNAAADLGVKGFDRQTAAIAQATKESDFLSKSLQEVQKQMARSGVSDAIVPPNQNFTRTPKEGKREKTALEKELDAVERRIDEFRSKYRGIEPPTFLKVRRAELREWLGMKEDGRIDLPSPELIGNQADSHWKVVVNGWKLSITRHALAAREQIGTVVANLQGYMGDLFNRAQDQKQARGSYDNADAAKEGFMVLAELNRMLNQTKESGSLGQAMSQFFNTEDMETAFKAGKIGVAGVQFLGQQMSIAIGGLTNGLREVGGNAFAGFFEALGASLAGSRDAFKKLGKSILGMIADLAMQIGKAMLILGAGTMLTGVFSPLAVKQLAAGAALVTGAGLIKTLVGKEATAFANGGIVSGPTLGYVGEYASARSGNPEVIAPLRTLKSLLQPTIQAVIDKRFQENLRPSSYGGNQSASGLMQNINIMIEGRLSGSDIYWSGQRFQKSKNHFS